ncbi:hypothetical protein ASPZODRAFT_128079 [Penicilliopsis zonata CBS 506.65]|uniref:Major facilitator superfamily (MFS) profile domain-containing protein n=1 Tax=Penicilliopsis zonata CBS 506.65 TaxID=1073090 RepID=A0A1L9SQU8_9EURO|nr:hypothetical protein ASPZODRAFT_128079 [Penicilliopsis zonata CBS 506.65]OJJ49590.1 hypothetical protein ASPZODRAFT_128079 [Penicilliopsis zonata CBS 506.65]
MATTTTAVELQPAADRNVTRTTAAAANSSSTTYLTGDHHDDVMQASLVADSEVPDGGYGWVVVCASAVLCFWFVGMNYCWGVFQAVLVQEGVSSASTLAFVGSLTTACISFMAMLNARIFRKLGPRRSGLLGICLFSLGQILASFTTDNVAGLLVTVGLIMGIGGSLLFMVSSVTPTQYFKAKRGIANGIVFAGGGLGGAVISFAANGLLQAVGIAWTFRTLGLITLATGLPAAYLIQARAPILPTSFVEWRLFRDYRFVLIFVGGGLATFPLFVPPFFLPLYAESLQMTSTAGAGLVAAFNFSSAIGRLLCGFSSDKIGPLNTVFSSLMLSALSALALWPVSNSLGPLTVFVIINGMANGGFFATMPTVVGNVFGSARVSVAMGMVVTGWGGGYLLGAPIAGYLLSASGGEKAGVDAFHPAIYYAGSMALCSAGLMLLARLGIDRRVMRKI